MKLDQIFVTSIPRTRQLRQKNTDKIANFGKSKFGIDVGFAGVDGSRMQPDQLKSLIQQGIIKPSVQQINSMDELIIMSGSTKKRFMTASEIGNFLSHFSFWNNMLQNNISTALILEDDAVFDDDVFYEQIMKVLEDMEKHDFKYVSLFKHPTQLKLKEYLDFNEDYHRIDGKTWGLVAYIIRLDAIKNLLPKCLPIKSKIDNTLHEILEIAQTGFLVKHSLVSLCETSTLIRHKYKQPELQNTNVNVTHSIQTLAIPMISHIFTVNWQSTGRELKIPDFTVEDIHEDFDLYTDDQIKKLIIEGMINPLHISDMKDKNKIVGIPSERRFMKTTEITQYLSHMKIWRKMVEQRIPYAIILDNSNNFDVKNFESHIINICMNSPKGFSTIQLNQPSALPNNGTQLFDIVTTSSTGTTAYVISLMGAINFSKKLPVIENTYEKAFRSIEKIGKTGYIYKNNIMKHVPTILEITPKKVDHKICDFFFLGQKKDYDTSYDALGIPPKFFEIDKKMANVNTLLSFNDGLINPNSIKNGSIFLNQLKKMMTQTELVDYLSNVSIWNIIVENNIQGAFIAFKNTKLVSCGEKIKALVSKAPHRTEFISFIDAVHPETFKCNEDFYYSFNQNNRMNGYYITLNGAKMLLKSFKPIQTTMSHLVYTIGLTTKIGYISKETFITST